MNNDLNIEPIESKHMNNINNFNIDESFNNELINLNPRDSPKKSLTVLHPNDHIDEDIDEKFFESYIIEKEDKVNKHDIKYEISISIGHSDFDSKVLENNTVKSKMIEKPLDLFKRIDADIDPTVSDDEHNSSLDQTSIKNQTIKLNKTSMSSNKSMIAEEEKKNDSAEEDFNFDKIHPDNRWLSDFNRITGDLIKYSFKFVNMNSYLHENTKLMLFN